MSKQIYQGRCHCGNISWSLESEFVPENITMRVCHCDFCTRHGPRYWSEPNASLRYAIADSRNVERYRFGTATADFHVCRRCGVFTLALMRHVDHEYGLLNLNTLTSHDPRALASSRLEALSETQAERIARRSGTWVGSVQRVSERQLARPEQA